MVESRDNKLIFTFPEIHPKAGLTITFERTLRIPDDGKTYPLPPSLGRFPLEHIDDYKGVPGGWHPYGGVMLPMYQSEALWLNFKSIFIHEHQARYPFAIKIATGKINAITGEPWSDGLSRTPQGYIVVPGQPWLDGYCVERGIIRQFVAMPLGEGYSVEEQLTGQDAFGGLQIEVIPMQLDAFRNRWPKVEEKELARIAEGQIFYSRVSGGRARMGLAPGGQMRQKIFKDCFNFWEWNQTLSSRCFVHLANSLQWKTMTGKNPPTFPVSAKEYAEHGLPWFDYYCDLRSLPGSGVLNGLESVFEKGKSGSTEPLPENESATPQHTVPIHSEFQSASPYKVREW